MKGQFFSLEPHIYSAKRMIEQEFSRVNRPDISDGFRDGYTSIMSESLRIISDYAPDVVEGSLCAHLRVESWLAESRGSFGNDDYGYSYCAGRLAAAKLVLSFLDIEI